MLKENLVLVDCEPYFLHTDKDGKFIKNDSEDVIAFEAGAYMSGAIEGFMPLDKTGKIINSLVDRVVCLTERACEDPEVQIISFQNPESRQSDTRNRLITPIKRLLDSCERAHSFNKYSFSGIKDIDEIDEVTELIRVAPKSRVIGVSRYLCVSAVAIEIKDALSDQEVFIDKSASLDLVAGHNLDRKVTVVCRNLPENEVSLEEKYGVLMTGEDLVEDFFTLIP